MDFTLKSVLTTFIITCLMCWTEAKTSRGAQCLTQASDIIFVLDSSFSIRAEDFQLQLVFLRALIDRFTIGDNHIRVGVVSFSSHVNLDIPLDKYSTSRQLKQAIYLIKQHNTGTETYKALEFVHKHAFSEENGGRLWAKRQVVLITDGLSQNLNETLRQASIAKDEGIEIFSIGVGGWFLLPEIRGIASEPIETHMYRVENYRALDSLGTALTTATCNDGMQGDQSGATTEPNTPSDLARARCAMAVADVVFVLDGSNSIWEPDFDLQKQFVNQVTSKLEVGPMAVRVSVVVYSDAPLTLMGLGGEQSHETIKKVLSDAPQVMGGTHTSYAIEHVRRNVFTESPARPNVAKILVLLTDGDNGEREMKNMIDQATLAHGEGIKIFAIGIGREAESKGLIALASKPSDQFVFHVKDYGALKELNNLLAIKACDFAASFLENNLPSSCPRSPRDTVFIYDPLALSPHHHKFVIGTIAAVTSAKGLNSEALRFGVLREANYEATTSAHDIELTNEWTRSKFKYLLEADAQNHASIDLLLRKARQKYFSSLGQFDNIFRKRTVVIFIDSPLKRAIATQIEAMRLKSSHQVDIVVVTMGKLFDAWEVDAIVSEPIHKYRLDSSVHAKQHHKNFLVHRLLSILCS